MREIIKVIKSQKWRWAEHIARNKDNRCIKRLLYLFLICSEHCKKRTNRERERERGLLVREL